MKVLVTGANGLLGHHIVNELLQRGEEVVIIVRSTRNIYFDLSKVILHQGNFNNQQHFTEAAKGCDAIIHVAAVTATDLLHYEDYSSINTDACKMIIEVADKLNIHRIVFVSTANTIGYGNKTQQGDENCDITYPFSKSYYAKSKLAAETLFINYAKGKNKHIIIVNPAFLIGSMDTKPSSGELMLMGYRKPLMLIPPGGKNFVYVKDVAIACCNAMTLGISGERYFAGNENLSFAQFYSLQSRVGGYNQKLVVIPGFILKIAGYFGDIFRSAGIKTSVCSMNINQLLVLEYYNNSKIRRELQMPQTNIEQAVEEALQWFEAHGYIK
jgi:dihydroflavonol-4-reductase